MGDYVCGPVAQLVSAPPCHGGGRGFKSRQGRGTVAQSVERPPEKWKVDSSILSRATVKIPRLSRGILVLKEKG